jgi:hypothetical protein
LAQPLGAPPQHQLFTIAAAIVIKQFRKAANKLHKNMPIYQRLSKIFFFIKEQVSEINISCKKNIPKWFSAILKKFPKKYHLS